MLRRLPLLAVLLAGCGSGSNFNRIWGGDDNGADGLLLRASAAYDRGDFATAEQLASKLITRDGDNVDAAILLGYVHLSQGGIDPYRLARQMLKLSSSTTTDTSTTTGAAGSGLSDFGYHLDDLELLADAAAAAPASADTSAAGTLQTLATALLALSDADLTNLTTGSFSAAQNGGVTPTLFVAGGPDELKVPQQVDDTLRASVGVLNSMNQAVKSICRFIDADVKVTDDDRDTAASCATTTVAAHGSAKANFLWAFSHLTEALVYQSVILYTTAGSATSSIQDVSNNINDPTKTKISSAADVTAFAEKVTEVKNAVDTVFDTSNPKSMIQAALVDLTEVTNAFAKMSGLPDSIKSKITDAYAKISDLGKQLGGASTTANNTAAFKSQMTASIGTNIGGKIDAATTAATAAAVKQAGATSIDQLPAATQTQIQTQVAAQVKPLCDTFSSLTKGQTVTKPTSCP